MVLKVYYEPGKDALCISLQRKPALVLQMRWKCAAGGKRFPPNENTPLPSLVKTVPSNKVWSKTTRTGSLLAVTSVWKAVQPGERFLARDL